MSLLNPHDLCGGIPINSVVLRPALAPSLYLGSSAVLMTHGKAQYYFHGCSVQHTAATARKVSQVEVGERLLAMPQLQSQTALGEGFPAFTFLGCKSVGLLPANIVLLVDKSPIGSQLKEEGANKQQGANGLALREKLDLAVQHAVQELVERHLAASLWYTSRRACRLGECVALPHNFTLCRFSIVHKPAVPFVMSVIGHRTIPVFYSGFAVRSTLRESVDAADREAIMLSQNYFADAPLGLFNSADNAVRLKSLSGTAAARRWEHLLSRIDNAADNSDVRSMNLSKLVSTCLPEPHRLLIAVIGLSPGAALVRAHHPSALNKHKLRRQSFPDVADDPFC